MTLLWRLFLLNYEDGFRRTFFSRVVKYSIFGSPAVGRKQTLKLCLGQATTWRDFWLTLAKISFLNISCRFIPTVIYSFQSWGKHRYRNRSALIIKKKKNKKNKIKFLPLVGPSGAINKLFVTRIGFLCLSSRWI